MSDLRQVVGTGGTRLTLQGAIEQVLADALCCASGSFPCNQAAALAERIMREVERRLPEAR